MWRGFSGWPRIQNPVRPARYRCRTTPREAIDGPGREGCAGPVGARVREPGQAEPAVAGTIAAGTFVDEPAKGAT